MKKLEKRMRNVTEESAKKKLPKVKLKKNLKEKMKVACGAEDPTFRQPRMNYNSKKIVIMKDVRDAKMKGHLTLALQEV